MTTLHDDDTIAADAVDDDASDDLVLPFVLDPTLVLSAGVLEYAYQQYLGDCAGLPNAVKQTKKAYTSLQTGKWSLTDDGALAITGSDGTTTYCVNTTNCLQRGVFTTTKKGTSSQVYCRGFALHSGACYHRVAFEILRIAQAEERAYRAA